MLPNPYAIIGGLVGLILLVTGAFFYGQHIGVQKEQAKQLVSVKDQFAGYVTAAGAAAAAGTATALADFKAQAGVLQNVADELRTTKGIMDNAAAKLAASLRNGGCFLSPDQRRMLECIRRPRDTACTAPSL